MKNNIEGGKSRNPAKEVAKKLIGPLTALTLLTTLSVAAAGCEGKTVNNYINIPPIAGTPRPSEAAGTPLPTATSRPSITNNFNITRVEPTPTVVPTATTMPEAKRDQHKQKATPTAVPTATPRPADPVIINNYYPEKTVTVIAPTAVPTATPRPSEPQPPMVIYVVPPVAPTATPAPTPAHKLYPEFRGHPGPNYTIPEISPQPDWIKNPNSSEIYVPNYGTTIDRYLGPNEIIAISGGPMTIDVDQNGYRRTLSFPGGSDRVTLVLFLGGQGRIIGVRNVVTANNWVGTYRFQSGTNPENQGIWQVLVNAKVQETMTASSSIYRGARYVDALVVNANNHPIYQNTFDRGY